MAHISDVLLGRDEAEPQQRSLSGALTVSRHQEENREGEGGQAAQFNTNIHEV